MNRFKHLIPLFFLTILLACSSTGPLTTSLNEGMGGTGAPQEGLGGTGHSPTRDEGLGGTGQIANKNEGIGGTGIVGEVTGFGSIWVSKAHVHYDPSTSVTKNQQAASVDDIKLGHIVSVASNQRPNKDRKKNPEREYDANRIDLVHEVVGPITQVVNNQEILVLEQKVLLSDKTQGNFAISSGQSNPWVEVSGFRTSHGSIKASRIDIISNPSEAATIGKLQAIGDHRYKVNNVEVQIDPWLAPENLNKRYLVKGSYTQENQKPVIIATQIGEDSIESLLNESMEVLIEGFLYEFEDDLIIGGFEFELPEDYELATEFDEELTIQIEADLVGEDFIIEDFYAIPEGFEDYEDLMPDVDFPEWEDDIEDFEDEFEHDEEFEHHEDFEHEEFEHEDDFEFDHDEEFEDYEPEIEDFEEFIIDEDEFYDEYFDEEEEELEEFEEME